MRFFFRFFFLTFWNFVFTNFHNGVHLHRWAKTSPLGNEFCLLFLLVHLLFLCFQFCLKVEVFFSTQIYSLIICFTYIRQLLWAGDLFVDGKVIHRPQFQFTERQQVRGRPRPRYDRRRETMQVERRDTMQRGPSMQEHRPPFSQQAAHNQEQHQIRPPGGN
jgi:hypothetical protein